MNWAEPLPPDCPPTDARFPQNEMFYRLINSSEPSAIDFYSHRMLWPESKFNKSECYARSISIFNEILSCQKVRMFPIHKNKRMIRIALPNESGLIKQSGKDISHHSWWRSKEFNPLEYCTTFEG